MTPKKIKAHTDLTLLNFKLALTKVTQTRAIIKRLRGRLSIRNERKKPKEKERRYLRTKQDCF